MTPTKVNILDLSEFVIRYSEITNKSITNLKLQKLLYFIQAFHTVNFEKHPLFDDAPEAWVNGPVYKEVYKQYKGYGANPIVLKYEGSPESSYEKSLEKLNLIKKQQEYLLAVLEHYGNMSAVELVILTHKGGPWNEVRKDLEPLAYDDSKITHDSMYEFYSKS